MPRQGAFLKRRKEGGELQFACQKQFYEVLQQKAAVTAKTEQKKEKPKTQKTMT